MYYAFESAKCLLFNKVQQKNIRNAIALLSPTYFILLYKKKMYLLFKQKQKLDYITYHIIKLKSAKILVFITQYINNSYFYNIL